MLEKVDAERAELIQSRYRYNPRTRNDADNCIDDATALLILSSKN